MKRIVIIMGVISAMMLTMAGCAASAAQNDSGIEESSAAAASSMVAVSSEAPVSSEPVKLILPDTENTTGKLLIQTVNSSKQYPYTSYAITSTGGETLIVDPCAMPGKEIVDLKPAAILSTHNHPDHTDPVYTKAYDCEKIICEKGEVTTKDFHIYTVASSHSSDTFDEDSKHVCMVIEVDGLRLVHMGDTGQTKLTDDQLAKLGKIDIAFMQFENSFSGMTLENEKGFNLANQLNPTLLIPTHYTDKALPVLTERYGDITEVENKLAASKDDLPEKAMTVYRITNTHKYK